MAKNCRSCGVVLETGFDEWYQHCHNCIVEEMWQGRRLVQVSNITFGHHWEFQNKAGAPGVSALVLMRKSIAKKDKKEIMAFPEFSSLEEVEYAALKKKALELGPIETSGEELAQLELNRIHRVETFAAASALSKVAPVVLITFDHDLFGRFHDTAKARGLLLVDVPWCIYFGAPDIVKHLKSKGIWFKGCHFLVNEEISRSEKFKCGWLAPYDEKAVEFFKRFICDCVPERPDVRECPKCHRSIRCYPTSNSKSPNCWGCGEVLPMASDGIEGAGTGTSNPASEAAGCQAEKLEAV